MKIDFSRPVTFLVHGWIESPDKPWIKNIISGTVVVILSSFITRCLNLS
jgi:hypothetical protein